MSSKQLKIFIKPFEAPQKSMKIKISVTFYRGGSRDFEKGWRSMSTTMVGRQKKVLAFRWSKKAKITLETISFQQNISISFFQFSPFRYIQSERLPKTSFKLLSNQMFQIVIKFFKICKRLDKVREKTIVQQSMRKEKMRKVGLCFCFIKSFNMIINHFFVYQAHSQPNFCFLIIKRGSRERKQLGMTNCNK